MVVVYELLGLSPADVQVGRQRSWPHAVEYCIVDRLGHAAFGVVHLIIAATEYQCRGMRVDVFACPEGLRQGGIAGHVGQYPQLDLRVVGADEEISLDAAPEATADAAAPFGADGDVLQVRPAAGKASGRGHCLPEIRMHQPGLRVHLPCERIHVGADQL